MQSGVRPINKYTGSQAYREHETHGWPGQEVKILRLLLFIGTKVNWVFPFVAVGTHWDISEISGIR